jgi:hypothetical protein
LNNPLGVTNDSYICDDAWNAEPDLMFNTLNWRHYVFLGSGTDIKLYRDNVLQNSAAIPDGADIGATAGNYFIGNVYIEALDDLKVYKRALSVAEINELFELDGNCLVSGFDNIDEQISIQEFNVLQ